MRNYVVTIYDVPEGAAVHIEAWGLGGADPECWKSTLAVRATNRLRDEINALAFVMDECTDEDQRYVGDPILD